MTTIDRADDLQAEVRYWKTVATYLADCHAATAYDYEVQSVSRSKRNRMIGILETCIAVLNKRPSKCGDHQRSEQSVTERCMDTITRLHNCNAVRK